MYISLTVVRLKVVRFHCGMLHSKIANKGDNLQIWRIGTNILDKQLQIADKGWLSTYAIGRG